MELHGSANRIDYTEIRYKVTMVNGASFSACRLMADGRLEMMPVKFWHDQIDNEVIGRARLGLPLIHATWYEREPCSGRLVIREELRVDE